MKRLVISISFLLLCLISTAQVPHGFNYQAIARDGTTPITITLPVMITIQSESTGGIIFWKELHSSVKPNESGLFSLVIGTGTRQEESEFLNFSDIDWSISPKYIMTEIEYGGWKTMGASELLSVPYSMIAGNLSGAVRKLAVTGITPDMEEALFEVKNKNDQTVFAVYNEGVRIYVDDGDAKGVKGGFAIGGFNTKKGESQPLLVVNPDSIRAYIDPNPTGKIVKGGFAIGGFGMLKGGDEYLRVTRDSTRIYINDLPGPEVKGGFAIGGFGQLEGNSARFLDVATDADGIINPSQNRILWYPLKNAFLAGNIIIEHPDSVGINSFSTGYQSRSIGSYSQAMGYASVARGNYSTSIGRSSITKGDNSFAFGNQAKAIGIDSYAFGTGAQASGIKSFALGSVGVDSTGALTGQTVASGMGAFALGFGSAASAQGAFTFGVSDSASGPFSLSMGYSTRSRGLCSTTSGAGTIVESTGWFGTANGIWTKAGSWAASAFGDQSYAKGHTSFATGFKTTAEGQLSSTFGDQTTTTGYASMAIGYHSTAQAYGSLTLGRYNIISGSTNAWNALDPVLVVGNGESPAARSNAMTVYKNGKVDLGSSINLNTASTGGALFVNGDQAVWYDDNYFSWGYDGSYNYFADNVTIGNPGDMGYSLYVQGQVYSEGGWAGSDLRWKKNLDPLDNAINKIMQLEGYRYNWRSDEFPEMNFDNNIQIGLIAQDVEKIIPELVRTDNNGFKAVSYEKLTVILLEGMKEQQKLIESVKVENQQLKSDIDELKALIPSACSE